MLGGFRFQMWAGCLALVLVPAAALAQVYSGSLTGLVTDPSGAAVVVGPDHLTDVNKGYSLTPPNRRDGTLPGAIAAAGNVPARGDCARVQGVGARGIVLNVDDNTSLDLRLEVGHTAGNRAVSSARRRSSAPRTRSVGQTLNRNFVNDLPLLGRNALDLATSCSRGHTGRRQGLRT